MMDTKLTLKLDEQVIRRAKEYAAAQNRSLSALVENYLKYLVNREEAVVDAEEVQISAFVDEMTKGTSIPVDLDSKESYGRYLTNKYS